MPIIFVRENIFEKGVTYTLSQEDKCYEIYEDVDLAIDDFYYFCEPLDKIVTHDDYNQMWTKKIKITSTMSNVGDDERWKNLRFCESAAEKSRRSLLYCKVFSENVAKFAQIADFLKYNTELQFEVVKTNAYFLNVKGFEHSAKIAHYILNNHPSFLPSINCRNEEFVINAVCTNPELYETYGVKDQLITKRILKRNPNVIKFIREPNYNHYHYVITARNSWELMPIYYYIIITLRECI